MLTTVLGRLRMIAILEGISFLVLLGIAMPLKYWADTPGPVRFVGMAHGVLFILYVLLLIQATFLYKWSLWKATLGFILSLVPFGTFYADKKLFRE